MTAKPPDPIFVLRGSKEPVASLKFINKESDLIKELSVGYQDGFVTIWNLETRLKTLEWKAASSSVLWEDYVSGQLWTCSRSDAVRVWDLGCGGEKCLQKFSLGEYLGFSQCNITHLSDNLLASPGPTQESVSVWDIKSGMKICSLEPPEGSAKYGSVMQIKWMLRNNQALHLLIVYESGDLCIWDWSNKNILSQVSIRQNPLCITFNSEMQQFVCGSTSEELFTIQLDDNFLKLSQEFSVMNAGIGCVANRDDGKLFATGGWDNRIRIFTWKKKKQLAVLQYHKKSVECIEFSSGLVKSLSKGYLLAAGSSDNSISLWDIYN